MDHQLSNAISHAFFRCLDGGGVCPPPSESIKSGLTDNMIPGVWGGRSNKIPRIQRSIISNETISYLHLKILSATSKFRSENIMLLKGYYLLPKIQQKLSKFLDLINLELLKTIKSFYRNLPYMQTFSKPTFNSKSVQANLT